MIIQEGFKTPGRNMWSIPSRSLKRPLNGQWSACRGPRGCWVLLRKSQSSAVPRWTTPSQLEFMEILMQGFQPTDQRVIRLSEHIDGNSCVSFRFKKLILYTLNDLDIPASNITLASRGQLFELTSLWVRFWRSMGIQLIETSDMILVQKKLSSYRLSIRPHLRGDIVMLMLPCQIGIDWILYCPSIGPFSIPRRFRCRTNSSSIAFLWQQSLFTFPCPPPIRHLHKPRWDCSRQQ